MNPLTASETQSEAVRHVEHLLRAPSVMTPELRMRVLAYAALIQMADLSSTERASAIAYQWADELATRAAK